MRPALPAPRHAASFVKGLTALAVAQSSAVFSRQNGTDDVAAETKEVAVSKKSVLQTMRSRVQQASAAAAAAAAAAWQRGGGVFTRHV